MFSGNVNVKSDIVCPGPELTSVLVRVKEHLLCARTTCGARAAAEGREARPGPPADGGGVLTAHSSRLVWETETI